MVFRRGYFPIILNGELIPVHVQLNKLTKFARLQVGKQIVTSKQRQGSQNALYPQSIAVSGHAPLTKVWVDYQPPPKNKFDLKVNDKSYYTFVKEDIFADLSKVEVFDCQSLKVNDTCAHTGSMPWILDQFEDKINTVYAGVPLESFEIVWLDCKTQVVNQFFDFIVSQDLADESFKKLNIEKMTQ